MRLALLLCVTLPALLCLPSQLGALLLGPPAVIVLPRVSAWAGLMPGCRTARRWALMCARERTDDGARRGLLHRALDSDRQHVTGRHLVT